MSMFILSQNGKVGVYGIGDRVIGSAGTEKALIMDGATNTIVDNTVEEIHLQNNIENLSFAVDENTNTVSIMNGNAVVASFAANEAGIKLFTANGMSVIKMTLDDQGNASFTADNGTVGTTPVALPTNGSALPSEAIDTNGKSENAGGTTPVPPVTEEGILVEDAAAGLANGTYKGGDYILDDSVANLNKATYAVVNGAKSITVADTVKNLKADDAANALALAANVKVEDTLQALALNDPFDFGGKSTSLVVASAPASNAKVKLGEVTVAEASGAQAKIDAFLARTDVDYTTNKVNKPTALTVGSYSIKDTGTAITNADADLLADATKVAVADSITGVSALTTAVFAEVDNIAVKDSLASITSASTALLHKVLGVATADTTDMGSTFATDDTTAASAILTQEFLELFDGSSATAGTGTAAAVSAKQINLSSLQDKATLSLTLEEWVDDSTGQAKGATLQLADSSSSKELFTGLKSTVSISVTGSDEVDTIKVGDYGVRVDGGLGADNITFGKGDDTLVLGTGITDASDYGTGTANADNITGFASEGKDKIDFAGFLNGFDSGYVQLNVVTNGGVANLNGKIAIVASAANFDNAATLAASFFGDNSFEEGQNMILITSADGSATKIWYVENADTDGKITAPEIHLVANLTDTKIADLALSSFA